MTSYVGLFDHLQALNSSRSELVMCFSEIERAARRSLPPSARKYRQWWANATSGGYHPHAQSWRRAGWRVKSVDFGQSRVTFERDHDLGVGG